MTESEPGNAKQRDCGRELVSTEGKKTGGAKSEAVGTSETFVAALALLFNLVWTNTGRHGGNSGHGEEGRAGNASFLCREDLPTFLLNYRAGSYIRFAARGPVATLFPRIASSALGRHLRPRLARFPESRKRESVGEQVAKAFRATVPRGF